jgi:hypothetical protein
MFKVKKSGEETTRYFMQIFSVGMLFIRVDFLSSSLMWRSVTASVNDMSIRILGVYQLKQ